MTLDLRRPLRIELRVERGVESNGSDKRAGRPYRYRRRTERCRWTGAALRAPGGVSLRLSRSEPSSFICSWDGMTSGTKTPQRFTIACRSERRLVEVRSGQAPAAAREVPILSCQLEGRIPRALEQASLARALLFSPAGQLRVSRTDDDSMVVGGKTGSLGLIEAAR